MLKKIFFSIILLYTMLLLADSENLKQISEKYFMNKELVIRETQPSDYTFIKEHIDKHWGGEPLVIRTKKYYSNSLPGLVATNKDKITGFLLYEIRDPVCEIIVFEVFDKFKGIGTHLKN